MSWLGINIKTDKQRKEELTNLAQQIISSYLTRGDLALRMGYQYQGDRKIYDALGYPKESELDFKYYLAKYERQDIATAIIDRPVDSTWNNFLYVTDAEKEESEFKTLWDKLEKDLSLTQNLALADRLMGIGEYSVLLFGFSDVKQRSDWEKETSGDVKLVYVLPISEGNATISNWETRPDNERYGQPTYYEIHTGEPGKADSGQSLRVHYSRVIHYSYGGLNSKIYGRPRLKPIINRLVDLEKLLGGDAEMFWRGARPGYFADLKEGFKRESGWAEEWKDQIKAYENDLRRILSGEGMDLKALAQQIADPLNHLDAQLQAISAQTGIPKRILVGSERGELASSQDLTQWNSIIKTRMEDFAEPIILNPFIDKLQEYDLLPDVEYKVVWEDLFAPSDKEKAEVGKIRADSLKSLGDSLIADLIPPRLRLKYFAGLDNDQIDEIENEGMEELIREETLEENLMERQNGNN